MHFTAKSEATKVNFLELKNFFLLYIAFTLPFHANRFNVLHDFLQHCYTLHGHVQAHQDQLPRVGGTSSCCTLHLFCLFILTVLMCCMMYLNTAVPFMAMSEATKISILGLGNFFMLYIASALHLHANGFDVLHDLLNILAQCPLVLKCCNKTRGLRE